MITALAHACTDSYRSAVARSWPVRCSAVNGVHQMSAISRICLRLRLPEMDGAVQALHSIYDKRKAGHSRSCLHGMCGKSSRPQSPVSIARFQRHQRWCIILRPWGPMCIDRVAHHVCWLRSNKQHRGLYGGLLNPRVLIKMLLKCFCLFLVGSMISRVPGLQMWGSDVVVRMVKHFVNGCPRLLLSCCKWHLNLRRLFRIGKNLVRESV